MDDRHPRRQNCTLSPSRPALRAAAGRGAPVLSPHAPVGSLPDEPLRLPIGKQVFLIGK